MRSNRDGVVSESVGSEDDVSSDVLPLPVELDEREKAEMDAVMSQPSKPDAYTLLKCWDNLKILLDNFDAKKKAEAAPSQEQSLVKLTSKELNAASEDKKAFETCYNAMKIFYDKGKKAQPTVWTKASYFIVPGNALSAVKLFENTFAKFTDRKKTQYIVHVKGPKSAEYYHDVIIPFLDDLSRVEHEQWLVKMCKLARRDLTKESARVAEISRQCKAIVDLHYGVPAAAQAEASQVATLNQVGQFAVPANPGKSNKPEAPSFNK